ncbi:FtsW/RodA/SpoVE family cell cycle protein [Streptomyces violaceorubidus]
MARHDRLQSEPTGEVRMSLSLRFAAGSHKGMIREGNEDSGYAGPRLLAIADGMGGQAAGEVASSEVISTIVALDDDVPGSDVLTSLGAAVQRANDQLRQMVEEDPALEGMGTTLTALLWTGQRLGMVHVGDSRAYLLRDGVQPGEFAKIVLAIFFAGYLMVKRDALALASRRFMGLYLPRGRDLGPILVVWIVSILILVFETDLGTSLLFFGMFVIMLYVATERTSWIVFGMLMSAVGAVGVATFEPHIQQRVDAWLDPMREFMLSRANQVGHSEQAMQALWAFGSGGTLGTGWGQGHSELIRFAANSDFILATFGEELGLAGLMALLLLYALIVERGVRTALAARDPFGKLLAIGLSGAFALQVFVVAGGVMGLIPLTGMTMPFLAYGGSSVIANWALIGILLRISDTARRPAPAAPANPDAEMTQVVRP